MKRYLALALCAVCGFAAFAVNSGDFMKKIELSLSAEAQAALGAETLADFPLPVRLSTNITGFAYSDFNYAGEDIAFADGNGNALEFELDTWNTEGESLYWVKVPALTKDTGLTVYYGAVTATVHSASNVWTRYAAVIHGGETLKDSSGKLAVTANSTVGQESGGIAGGCIRKATRYHLGLFLDNPAAALSSNGIFSVSAWYLKSVDGTHIISAARQDFVHGPGFMALIEKGTYLSVAANNKHQWSSGNYMFENGVWGCFAFTYEKDVMLKSYFNGQLDNSKEKPGVLEADPAEEPHWSFGSGTTTHNEGFAGDMDEIRVYDGVASAAWLQAEYGFAATSSWVSAGAAQVADPERVYFAAPPELVATADGLRVTVTLSELSHAGEVYALCGASEPYDCLSLIAANAQPGETVSGLITNLPASVCTCGFGVLGVSAADASNRAFLAGEGTFLNGEIAIAATRDADESAPGVPGRFTVSRPAAETSGALVVNYTLGGTAVSGVNFAALPGSVTIPDGAASATIDVTPLRTYTGHHTLTLSLATGLYRIPSADSATIAIRRFEPNRVFKKQFDIRLGDAAVEQLGGETLEDFPLPVRLSTAIAGFDYGDLTGGDVFFTDDRGAELAYELDSFDADGTSLYWVKVPALSATTRIHCFYGADHDIRHDATAVWKDRYAGVWHYRASEAGGTSVADAAGNGLDATAEGSLSETAGPFGTPTLVTTGRIVAPDYNDLIDNASVFSASGWFKMPTCDTNKCPFVIYKKQNWTDGTGWYLEMTRSKDTMSFVPGGSGVYKFTVPDVSENWTYYHLVSDGTDVNIYLNGSTTPIKTLTTTILTNNCSFRIADAGNCSDELRIRNGASSLREVACEYGFAVNPSWVVCEAVTDVDSNAVLFACAPVLTATAEGLRLTATLSQCSAVGDVYAVCGASAPYDFRSFIAAGVQPGETVSGLITNMPADAVCGFGALGVSADDPANVHTRDGEGTFVSGAITVACTRDAYEADLATPGVFTVTRPATATNGALVVNYTASGTAVAGEHYRPLSGSVAIPDGETSATISVLPVLAGTIDHVLTLSLAPGFYRIDPSTAAASMTIVKLDLSQGFSHQADFEVSGYAGATLTNFPVLVKLSESLLGGFRYADCKLENGGDLRFVTSAGILPCEVDDWDTNGTSFVWVRVPEFNASTKLRMLYGNASPMAVDSTNVWRGTYLGVWHMNEIANGVTPDSSGNGLDFTGWSPSTQVVDANGQVSKSLVSYNGSGKGGFLSPTYADRFNSPDFSVSCWFNTRTNFAGGWLRYFSSKTVHTSEDGFEMECSCNAKYSAVRGSSGSPTVSVAVPDQNEEKWNKFTLVFSGDIVTAYTNGVRSSSGTITTVNHVHGLAIGNNAAGNEAKFRGSVDEVRFAKSSESAEWVQAEYAVETGAIAFGSEYGSEKVDAAAVTFDGRPTVVRENGCLVVKVRTAENAGTGTITAHCVADDGSERVCPVASATAASTDYSAPLTGLAANRRYRLYVIGENANGTTRRANGLDTFYGLPGVVILFR